MHKTTAPNPIYHSIRMPIGSLALVLLSRVPTLDDLLLLRLPDPFLLNRPRPETLRTAYEHFQAQELHTLKHIDAILAGLNKQVLRNSITIPLLRDAPSSDRPCVPSLAFNPCILFSNPHPAFFSIHIDRPSKYPPLPHRAPTKKASRSLRLLGSFFHPFS